MNTFCKLAALTLVCLFTPADALGSTARSKQIILTDALEAAIEEKATKIIPFIIEAGAKPTNELLDKVFQKTLPIAEEVYGRKTPENFEDLQKYMRIIKTFYANGATKSNEKLANNLTWLIRKFQENGTFRDKDIEKFNTEFAPEIEQIKGSTGQKEIPEEA